MAKSNLTELQRNTWLGRIYGRLTVMENPAKYQLKIECLCSCGKTKIVAKSSLCSGATTSCGCFNKEVVSDMRSTHKSSYTPMYRVWAGMVNRCTNPNNSSFDMYGGRGITVCERWLHDFPAFLEDMGERPTSKHQIDRIDNFKGYSKDNCRWLTCTENTRNTRRNVKLNLFGEYLTVSEWSLRFNISSFTIYNWAKVKSEIEIENAIKSHKNFCNAEKLRLERELNGTTTN